MKADNETVAEEINKTIIAIAEQIRNEYVGFEERPETITALAALVEAKARFNDVY